MTKRRYDRWQQGSPIPYTAPRYQSEIDAVLPIAYWECPPKHTMSLLTEKARAMQLADYTDAYRRFAQIAMKHVHERGGYAHEVTGAWVFGYHLIEDEPVYNDDNWFEDPNIQWY